MRPNYLLFIGMTIPIVACGLLVLTMAEFGQRAQPSERDSVAHFVSQAEDKTRADASLSAAAKYSVTIRQPAGPPTVKIEGTDPQGRTGTASCATCHSVRPPNRSNTPAQLDEFHQGMTVAHGNLGCYACHNPDDSNQLHLADGTSVAYQDVMTLCSQCHGAQAVAFEKGAHGGMNGFWDLSRGPQERNNCIDCHRPHHPKYPKMTPTFKPRDRFLDPPQDDHSEEHSSDSPGVTDHASRKGQLPHHAQLACVPNLFVLGDVA